MSRRSTIGFFIVFIAVLTILREVSNTIIGEGITSGGLALLTAVFVSELGRTIRYTRPTRAPTKEERDRIRRALPADAPFEHFSVIRDSEQKYVDFESSIYPSTMFLSEGMLAVENEAGFEAAMAHLTVATAVSPRRRGALFLAGASVPFFLSEVIPGIDYYWSIAIVVLTIPALIVTMRSVYRLDAGTVDRIGASATIEMLEYFAEKQSCDQPGWAAPIGSVLVSLGLPTMEKRIANVEQ
jgi:hypothetical protein